MDEKRWSRTKELFDASLSLTAPERKRYLDEACGQDSELREAVEALVREDERDDEYLDPPSSTEFSARLDPDLGRRIGPYRLDELIGRGGMASVYRAVRVDGHYEQEVAIKLIRRSMNRKDVLARFRKERQILARLEHSCVARLLDGGATSDGLPFLVMELVRGLSIVGYSRKNELSVDERLELFQQVCGAVHHAHDLGVVHRDLKPSNILVTEEGTPKLLDFGIAKLLEPGEGENQDAVTRTELRLLTPQYASPEQIVGDPVSHATDVHSLGVVLYELLTGELPFRTPTGNQRKQEQAVLEREAQPPSRLALKGDRIASDLDTIVLKALRKEPHERYASARALAEDIERHRRGEPIVARPASWRYRTAKFLQRNRGLVTSSAFALGGLAIGLAVIVSVFAPTSRELVLARQRESARLLTEGVLAFERNDADAAYHTLARVPEEDRGWEWRHLSSLADQSLAYLAPDRLIASLTFEPRTGALLAVDGYGQFLILDSETGAIEERHSGYPGAGREILTNADGSRFAVRFEYEQAVVFDSATLTPLRAVQRGDHGLSGVALSPDGRILVTSAFGRRALDLVDVDTGELRTLACAEVAEMVFFPDGERLLVVQRNGEVRTLETSDGETDLFTVIHGGGLTENRITAAVSPNGRIAAVGDAQDLILLDLESTEELRTIRIPRGFVRHVAIRPDGQEVAAALMDATVRRFDVETGQQTGIHMGHWGFVAGVAYSSDQTRIASGGDGIRLWDPTVQPIEVLQEVGGSPTLLAVSPDGTRVAATSMVQSDYAILTLDGQTGERISLGISDDRPLCLTWMNSRELAVGCHGGQVELWDTNSGLVTNSYPLFDGRLIAIAYQNGFLATASNTGELKLHDLADFSQLSSQNLEANVGALAFSPDSAVLVAGMEDGRVVLYETPTLKLAGVSDDRHDVAVHDIAFHPEGHQFATASSDYTTRLWSSRAGLMRILHGHSSDVRSVAYVDGGSRLMTSSPDNTIRFYDPDTGQAIAVLHTTHIGPVRAMELSPDQSRLYTADSTGRIEVRRAPR